MNLIKKIYEYIENKTILNLVTNDFNVIGRIIKIESINNKIFIFICSNNDNLVKKIDFSNVENIFQYDISKISYFSYFDSIEKGEVPIFLWNDILKLADINELKDGLNPILYVFQNNHSKNLNLSNKKINDLILKSDLTYQTEHDEYYKYYENALISAFINNKKEKLYLTESQFWHLIKNSNLYQYIHKSDSSVVHRKHERIEHPLYGFGDYGLGDVGDGKNALLLAISNNYSQSLNLTTEQFKYLIKNSDPKHYDDYSLNAFLYSIELFYSQCLPFDNDIWNYLIENSDIGIKTYEWVIINIFEPEINFQDMAEKKINFYYNFNEEQWKKIINKYRDTLKEFPNRIKINSNVDEICDLLKKYKNITNLSDSHIDSLLII